MPTLREILGINLRYYRFLENESQEQFYTTRKLDHKYCAKLERGQKNVRIDEIEKLSKAINVSANELLLFDENHIIKKKRIDQKSEN